MNVRHLQNSFSGGEVAPEMYSRVNDTKYTTGASRMRNFVAMPNGPAVRRPGLMHVRPAINSGTTYKSRLIPFVVGGNDSLVLELSEGWIRFHTAGQTLLYARTRDILSVDAATDRITFKAPHQFAHGDAVKFLGESGAAPPGGTTEITTYYVRIVSATVIEISSAAGPGAKLDLTTAGTLPMTLIPLADYIGIPRPSAVINTIDLGTEQIDTIVGHELQTDDPIHFTSTGAYPTYGAGIPIAPGVTYYALRINATFFQVQLTPGGGPINFVTTGGGTRTVFRKLPKGTVYSYPGLGSYYTRVEYDTAASGLPYTGEYQLPTNYLTAELDAITYNQVGATIEFAHANHNSYKLTRVSASQWTFDLVVYYGASVAPPVITYPITKTIGEAHYFYMAAGTRTCVPVAGPADPTTQISTTLQPGDFIYCEAALGAGTNPSIVWAAGTYMVTDFAQQPSAPTINWFQIRLPDNTYIGSVLTTYAYGRRVTLGAEATEVYVVTSLTSDGSESAASSPITGDFNWLSVPGASNTIVWTAAAGAVRYRVYKLQSGLYGLIGETDGTSFKDDDLPVALDISPPYVDTTLSAPGVIGRFEQRKIFAAPNGALQTMWLSRQDTEETLSYHLPILDTDRIRFTLSGPEACPIRHVVPLTNLLVLTETAEFVVTPVNSDAITPTSFRARVVTTVGCSTRKPLLTPNGILYEAARGGRVRQFNRASEGGYTNEDLSVRAGHLFDGSALTSSAMMKAPLQVGWWTSTTGYLLGVTYLPEEGVAGWHRHDCYGSIESVCCAPEGAEDALYVSVFDGTKRSILRMREFDHSQPAYSAGELVYSGQIDTSSGVYLDNSKVVDWRNKTADTMLALGSTTWKAGAPCTIVSSAPVFLPGMENDGGVVSLTDAAGTSVEFTITAVVAGSPYGATVVPTSDVPLSLRVTVKDWRLKFKVFRGFNHLDGQTVSVMADGAWTEMLVTSGTITLTRAASVVCAGRSYLSQLRSLPPVLRIDQSLGQGRLKNINRAWVDVIDTVSFSIGTDEGLDYVQVTPDTTVAARDRVDVNFRGDWDDEASVWIETSFPWPLTVAAIGLEVSLGP